MVSEELLDQFRISGELVRVVRDELESNDVKGIVVAWDDDIVLVRKPSKRVVKLSRSYTYIAAAAERPTLFQ